MACALSQLKKEVTVVSAGAGLLPDIFDEETGLLLKQILEGKGIRVFSENAVEEILGEGEVKAVKLSQARSWPVMRLFLMKPRRISACFQNLL